MEKSHFPVIHKTFFKDKLLQLGLFDEIWTLHLSMSCQHNVANAKLHFAVRAC